MSKIEFISLRFFQNKFNTFVFKFFSLSTTIDKYQSQINLHDTAIC